MKIHHTYQLRDYRIHQVDAGTLIRDPKTGQEAVVVEGQMVVDRSGLIMYGTTATCLHVFETMTKFLQRNHSIRVEQVKLPDTPFHILLEDGH